MRLPFLIQSFFSTYISFLCKLIFFLMLCPSFKQLPVEIYQLPSSSNVVLSIEDQINENRNTIREILDMNPYEQKVYLCYFHSNTLYYLFAHSYKHSRRFYSKSQPLHFDYSVSPLIIMQYLTFYFYQDTRFTCGHPLLILILIFLRVVVSKLSKMQQKT